MCTIDLSVAVVVAAVAVRARSEVLVRTDSLREPSTAAARVPWSSNERTSHFRSSPTAPSTAVVAVANVADLIRLDCFEKD